jgi:hypothetical protein
MKILDWTLARLAEESTWRGIILVGTSLGATLDPERWQAIMAVGLSVVGLINILKKQGASKEAVAEAINTSNNYVPRAIVIDEKTLLPK